MLDELFEPGTVTLACKPKSTETAPGVWQVEYTFKYSPPKRDADAIGDACCDDLRRLWQGWNRQRWNRG
jgi:hypothetical protein